MSLPVKAGALLVIAASAALSRTSPTQAGLVPPPAHFIATFGEGIALAVGSFLVSWGMLRAKSTELDKRTALLDTRIAQLERELKDKADCDAFAELTRRVDNLFEGGERRRRPR